MPTLLAIETSGESGGAAILRDGEVVHVADVSGPRRHGAELMKCIDQACVRAGVARDQIDLIAVNEGPGSYTGLRIGLSTAAALGYALDKPVIGVPCFDAMCMQYVKADGFNGATELWPVLDARRDEVMTAKFMYDGGTLTRAGKDKLVAPEKLHEEADGKAAVFGDGVQAYADRFNNLSVDKTEFQLGPAGVAMQAWKQLEKIGDIAKIERKPVEPRYFRRILAKTVAERAGEV